MNSENRSIEEIISLELDCDMQIALVEYFNSVALVECDKKVTECINSMIASFSRLGQSEQSEYYEELVMLKKEAELRKFRQSEHFKQALKLWQDGEDMEDEEERAFRKSECYIQAYQNW